MLVRDWMHGPGPTLKPEDNLASAMDLIEKNRVSCLPVLEKGILVGIVRKEDLRKASSYLDAPIRFDEDNGIEGRQKAKTVMQSNPVAILFDGTLDEAAYLMLEHGLTCLPVIFDNGKFLGILTQKDILLAFIALMSCPGRGLEYGISINETGESLTKIIMEITGMGGRISSLISTTDQTLPGFRRVYFRISDIAHHKKAELKSMFMKNGILQYVIDQENNQREVNCSAGMLRSS